MTLFSSRIPGFHRLSIEERRALISRCSGTAIDVMTRLLDQGGLVVQVADKTVENALGIYSLPLGLALNFRVNDVDRLIPMVVEEPSVIAAASSAARIIRNSGGFRAKMVESLMTGQVEVRDVVNMPEALDSLREAQSRLFELANASTPSLAARGGGIRELQLRDLGDGMLVIHFHVDCKEAMGANMVNTMAEAIGPTIAQIAKGRLGLRILTNLCDRRRVMATCQIAMNHLVGNAEPPNETHDPLQLGRDVASAIMQASRFAELDPYRAATHNKGVMNGIDSVVIATGNDYRAVEAGAHAWAARSGRYQPIARWHIEDNFLVGRLELPLALGIVGGTLRVHPTAQWALSLMGITTASELSELAACAGLASNFAALRALATEGIQRGHMSLHARSVALCAGASPSEVEQVARLLVESGRVNEASAKDILRRNPSNNGKDKP